MLSIFKQKKIALTAIFPENFVDIHSHLLPGLDDGSKNMADTLALLKRLHGYGINNFVFTPHIMESVWENTSETIDPKQKQVKKHLKSVGMTSLKTRAAAEYMLDGNFAKILQTEALRTIKDSKILVEMSYSNAPINLYDMLFSIQIAGYQPILAHPERYSFYHNNFKAYNKLKEAGCLFQLNLLSLSNYYGKGVKKTAIRLLKENMIDFVGTDTHHHRHLDALEKIDDPAIIKLIAPVLKNNEVFL